MLTETLEHHPTHDPRLVSSISALLLRVRREYREMPGLSLTEAQAQRLWHVDRSICRVALRTLLECRFLKRTATGTYVLAADERAAMSGSAVFSRKARPARARANPPPSVRRRHVGQVSDAPRAKDP